MPTAPADRFAHSTDAVSTPARRAFAVVPSDSEPIAILPKALLIGGAGTLILRPVDSPADVVIPAAAGQLLPIRASHVRATGTTATQIVALA